MGQPVVKQLLRLMLFAKLFGFNLSTSGIWQLVNIWLEIGKELLKSVQGTNGDVVMPINELKQVALGYVGKIRYITEDMQNFNV
jgi:hypothetical protein